MKYPYDLDLIVCDLVENYMMFDLNGTVAFSKIITILP